MRISPQIHTVRDCFGADPQPIRPQTDTPVTTETTTATPSEKPPTPAPVVKPAPSATVTSQVIAQTPTDPQRVETGATILAELQEPADCGDEPASFDLLDDEEAFGETPVDAPANEDKSRLEMFNGTAGLNNDRGNLYVSGSLLTLNQVDGYPDPMDLVDVGTHLFGMGDADSLTVGNLNIEYGALDQITVQGGVVALNTHIDADDSWVAGSQTQVVAGQLGANLGVHNPDGSVGLNFGAAADAIKGTKTLDDKQGGTVAVAAGLGVSLPSGHIGMSDRDKDGISEVTYNVEGELGIGVAISGSTETIGGVVDDYIAPVLAPAKRGLDYLSDSLWSVLPEI